MTHDQPTAAPTRKVTAGGLGGAVAIVAVWIIETAITTTVPGPVAAALAVLAGFGTSYFVREEGRPDERGAVEPGSLALGLVLGLVLGALLWYGTAR